MLDLYLIRHAESEMNNLPLIGGRSGNSPLSARGNLQAILVGGRLRYESIFFNEVYSSPAVRAVKTAKEACKMIDYPLDKIVQYAELDELSMGDWEGKPRVEIYTPEMLAHINSNNWEFKAPNGESQREVEERMYGWVKECLLSRQDQNLTVGVFSHGMAIKCLLRGIMEFAPKITYKIALDNTSITRLKYTERGWHLMAINDTAHLLGEQRLKDPYS